jgi:hypothetical protein
MKNKDSKNINRMSIKEFRQLGYLQELNRQFLHPLGLALETILNDDGTESLGGIWDSRDDLEGIYYDIANSSKKRIERFRKNANYVDSEFIKRIYTRADKLGFSQEPIPLEEEIVKIK